MDVPDNEDKVPVEKVYRAGEEVALDDIGVVGDEDKIVLMP